VGELPTLHAKLRRLIKEAIKKLPGIKALVAQRGQLRYALVEAQGELAMLCPKCEALRDEIERLRKSQGFVPPGHFYSPVPDLEAIRRDENRVFGNVPRVVPGIDLREADQLALLQSFVPYYQNLPFTADGQPGLRYRYDNPAYSYSDAILLHCMMRHLQPRRIIEVGSGFSSCMMLDTNELYFDGAIATTFIEPYPELLLSLLKESDHDDIEMIPTRLQDVDPGVFDALAANDILFIDSTHVSKIDSDVNHILFNILPRLAPGVRVHFHDIFYPFEYPQEWVMQGRVWSEIYLLKAFLQYNSRFHVVLMNTFMEHFHADFFHENLPLCMKNTGGSIWLCKE